MQIDDADLDRLPDLAKRYLGSRAPVLLANVDRSARLHLAGRCGQTSPGSRFGGQALLPSGLDWPRTLAGEPLSFLGQIDTRDIAAVLPGSPLPSDALLAFFFEANEEQGWGYHPNHAQYWHVQAVDPATAVPTTAPRQARVFDSHAVTAQLVTTIPDRAEACLRELWDADDDALTALYVELCGGDEELLCGDGSSRHRMLGWPDLVQESMQLECQLASHGIDVGFPEGYHGPAAEALRPGAADWRLLLQIDTDFTAGWMWGDAGSLYYWTTAEQLRAGRFETAWMVLQCG